MSPDVARPVRRLAMISLHTSPLDQPGTGDAGGMNVYVIELARRLARQGIEVDVFTRATSSALPPVVEAADGVLVRHVHAGPYEGLAKDALPGQLCVFAREVLRTEAVQPRGHYDAVHSHYWLSGQVGALARDRWGVPLVHTMHTMARVKNESLAEGDTPEPEARVIGEQQVVEAADVLVANTDIEAKQLINLYDADPGRVEVVHPGVDLDVFRPGSQAAARAALGLPADAQVVLFAGRIQPLKAPDVLLRAVLEHPESLVELAVTLGLDDVVRFVPPVAHSQLAQWYAAATLVAVPSYNESFGLVAAEAGACGTPVVAAAVGGLPTVVRHERSGLLVDTHDDTDWARALARVLTEPGLHDRLAAGAAAQARGFSWDATAGAMLETYERARQLMRAEVTA